MRRGGFFIAGTLRIDTESHGSGNGKVVLWSCWFGPSAITFKLISSSECKYRDFYLGGGGGGFFPRESLFKELILLIISDF